jgi:cysteine-rich repeat protein
MYRTSSLTVSLVLALSIALLAACPPETVHTPVCGDGVLDTDETCDNGPLNSDTTPGACRTTCRPARCGDYVIDPGETCDDGNLLDGDGCSPTCTVEAFCGDGNVDADEQCDDGNVNPGDGCSALCRLEFTCGNGTCETDRNETCALCPQDCCPCGDGACEVGKGETCGMCHEDCCPACGNGILDPAEQCDDGNLIDLDGCSRDCKDEDGIATCGNDIWESGEQCDDGNTVGGDGCSETCQVDWLCGDGACDTQFGESCQLCQSDCCPLCGNGVLNPGEECDGAQTGGLTCGSRCYEGGSLFCTAWCTLDWSGCTGTPVSCGDGVVECGEECDGANLDGQDCLSRGYDVGTLACGNDCTFDYTQCGPPLVALETDFEGGCPPAGWTLTGTWQCGTPSVVGPATAHSGSTCLGTIINGNYANSLTWAGNTATSPEFSLAAFAAPRATFYMWVDTEGSIYDGANLKISVNGGTTYTTVTTVTPAYALTIDGQPAWGGHQATSGWQAVVADLTAYAGQTAVRLQFAFRTDGSVQYPGVYIDDIHVAD